MNKIVRMILMFVSLVILAEPTAEFHSVGSDDKLTNIKVAPIQIDAEKHWIDDETSYYLVPANMIVFLNNIVNTTVYIDTDNENPKSYKQALNTSYGKDNAYALIYGLMKIYEVLAIENVKEIQFYIDNVSSNDRKLKESRQYLQARNLFEVLLNDLLKYSVVNTIPVQAVSTEVTPDMFTEQLEKNERRLVLDISKDLFSETYAEINKIPQNVIGNSKLRDYSVSVMVQKVGDLEQLPVVPVFSNDDLNEIKDKPDEIKKRIKKDVVTTTVLVTRIVYKNVDVIAIAEDYYIVPLEY